eukprot:s2730_g3.t1
MGQCCWTILAPWTQPFLLSAVLRLWKLHVTSEDVFSLSDVSAQMGSHLPSGKLKTKSISNQDICFKSISCECTFTSNSVNLRGSKVLDSRRLLVHHFAFSLPFAWPCWMQKHWPPNRTDFSCGWALQAIPGCFCCEQLLPGLETRVVWVFLPYPKGKVLRLPEDE